MRRVFRSSRTGWLTRPAGWSGRLRPSWRIFRRAGGRRRRNVRMAWRCCGGSVWAVGVPWDQATRAEARDFIRWLQVAGKPVRPHWRHPGDPVPPRAAARPAPNPVTGKAPPGPGYAPVTVAHCETVARGFYEFHVNAGAGPMVNPFPLARGRAGQRSSAHRSPLEPFRAERSGLYRPRMARRRPRQIPDEQFSELFAALGSHRDRALVAFWVSSGVRAAELLGATVGDADPGQQLITVIRKGSGRCSQSPRPRTRSCGCGSTRRR